MLKITIPLPARELSPNARCHYRVKAAAVKLARVLAFRTARTITGGQRHRMARAVAQARFYFATRGRRDTDNLLASLKPTFDGLTDAGIWLDDAGVTHLPVEIFYDKKYPRVEIEILAQ